MVAIHNLIHELPQNARPATDGSKLQVLVTSRPSTLCLLTSIEINMKRSSATPEPVMTRSRNKSDSPALQRCVHVQTSNALKELLIEKPFLHPDERGVFALDRDAHRCLIDDSPPCSQRNGAQINADPADDHQQRPTRRKLVLASEHSL